MILLLLLSQVALVEYAKLVRSSNNDLRQLTMQVTGFLALLLTWNWHYRLVPAFNPVIAVVLPTIILFIEFFRSTVNPFYNAALCMLGILWIVLPFCLFLSLSFWPYQSSAFNPFIVLGYFVILWFGDTFAYFIGKRWGHHKLFQRISPNKTWEGSAAGLVMACLAAVIAFHSLHQLNLNQWLVLALIINITGTVGDLTKSLLKRSVHVKDAGTILPGHGGILDRFDSLIGSVPFAFLYLNFL